jgi:hypothetical protein
MRNWYPSRQRLAAVAGILAVALAVAAGPTSAFAENGDDDDAPLDTKLFRNFMKTLGFKNGDLNSIEYRERAPLVVPPSRNLPPPQAEAPSMRDPAWPKDPDVARRQEASAAEKAKLRRSGDIPTEDARVLRPDELRGNPAAATSGTERARPSAEEAARPLPASELAGKTNWLDSMWSAVGPQRPESAPFSAEPPRTSMTAPPAGYQTPSPNQPYGLGVKTEKGKAQTLDSRLEAQR